MTTTGVLDQPATAPTPQDPPRRRITARRAALALAPLPTAAAGAALVTWSYSLAATRGADETHYLVFWLGMLTVAVPAATAAGARRTSPRTRLIWILTYAVFSFLPKLLRNPSQPLFHDEIAHWRQSANLAASGQLFQPDPLIGIIGKFPGLHIVVATISDVSGLSVWRSAVVLLLIAHVTALLGAVALGEAVLGSLRAGTVVALIYSFNSSFMYFDTQLGYESLAIVLFIWCLFCVAKLQNARTRRGRLAWTAAAAALGCGVVPIHHLTSLILVLALAVVSIATAVRRRWQDAPAGVLAPTLAVTGLVAVSAGLWIALVAPDTVSYLSPYFGSGLSQLTHLFSGSGGGRTLFSASTEPSYERLAAFASPLIVGVLALAGLLVLRRRARAGRARHTGPSSGDAWSQHMADWPPTRIGLGLFGLLYFPSVPFILVSSGAEGARRSWAFTYLGLAILITPVVLGLIDSTGLLEKATWLNRTRWLDPARWRARAGRRVTAVAALAASCVLLIGNVAAGLNEDYRFPGPYVFGSDTRSITPELVGTADWFGQHIGTNQLIVTDRYTGLAFVREADAWTAAPSAGFPTYDLYFHDGRPPGSLVQELSSSHYAYLVIDRRMATELPAIGVFFEPDEPFAYTSRDPITVGALAQYENYPWTTLLYQSDDYAIYRFDFGAIGAHATGTGTGR
jgi:hypothetical protein